MACAHACVFSCCHACLQAFAIADDDLLISDYSCALRSKHAFLQHGRLYVLQQRLLFLSRLFPNAALSVPLAEVRGVRKFSALSQGVAMGIGAVAPPLRVHLSPATPQLMRVRHNMPATAALRQS